MEKMLMVDGDKCTGCCVCELVCSMARCGEYNTKHSYIRIIKNKELDVNIPVVCTECLLCGKCVEWCFPEALKLADVKEAAIIRKKGKIGHFPVPLVGWDL